jgi:hypothetical protein
MCHLSQLTMPFEQPEERPGIWWGGREFRPESAKYGRILYHRATRVLCLSS